MRSENPTCKSRQTKKTVLEKCSCFPSKVILKVMCRRPQIKFLTMEVLLAAERQADQAEPQEITFLYRLIEGNSPTFVSDQVSVLFTI